MATTNGNSYNHESKQMVKWTRDRRKKNHLIEFCLNETAKSLTVFCLACGIPVQVTGLGRQLLKRGKSIILSSQLQSVLADAISLPYLGFLTGDEVPAAPWSWIRKCEWTQSYVILLIWEYLKSNPWQWQDKTKLWQNNMMEILILNLCFLFLSKITFWK